MQSRIPFTLFRRNKKSGGRNVPLKTWWVRYSKNGRQVRASLHTQDQVEAMNRAAELVSNPGSSAETPEILVLSDFIEEYKRHMFATKSKKTAQNEWSVLSGFLIANYPDWSRVTLKDVTTSVISNYIDRRRIEDGISEKTAYHTRQALHTMFNYAVRIKGFGENPAHNVAKPRVPLGEIRYLRSKEIHEVLAAMKEVPLLYGIVATAIFSGLRRSELVWLTWRDVDLERDRIHVRFKTVHGERYRPKTNKSRIVPISKELHAVLAELQQEGDWVFKSPEGHRWDPDNLSDRLEKAM
jgi:integrase